MQIDSIEFDMCHRMQQSNLARQRARFTFWDIARAEESGFVGAPGLLRGGWPCRPRSLRRWCAQQTSLSHNAVTAQFFRARLWCSAHLRPSVLMSFALFVFQGLQHGLGMAWYFYLAPFFRDLTVPIDQKG